SGYSSNPSTLLHGVPQGSVLGPILFLLYTQPLSQIIDRHSISHSEFADDSQLYDSVPREQFDSLLSNMQSCVDDVKLWMTQNKLQLNEGKTEALLIDPQNSPNLPLSITIGQNDICFSRSVRNLGVIFDDKLSMKQQVSKICQSAYLELRRISSIRHVLTVDATKTLVTSLVLSRLDYCNSLLSGIPQQLIDKLQKVQNCSARLIFKTSKCTHVSPLLAKLHWLPIAQRIDYKISSLCYDVVSDTAPLYLSDLLCLYVPSRSLRSSADTRIFRIPTRKKKFQGQRAFSHLGPVTWNKLPYSVRHAQTQSQFKTQLKTTLFRSVYEPDS
ncbi:reverse transcriptase domain-containing protein, partial [Thiolapillus sp.]